MIELLPLNGFDGVDGTNDSVGLGDGDESGRGLIKLGLWTGSDSSAGGLGNGA